MSYHTQLLQNMFRLYHLHLDASEREYYQTLNWYRKTADNDKQWPYVYYYRQDKKRKNYHNYYCKGKWGDSRNYDISVNSSKLGEEETTQMLVEYIMKRQKLV